MIIKLLIAGGAAVAALGASAAVAQTGEAGSYASAAITSGKLVEAERLLRPVSQEDANDPARLINIATIYSRTQRFAEARAALTRVQALPAEKLELSNGTSYSSHAIARAMISRLGD